MSDQSHLFLSDEWIQAARHLREEFAGSIQPPPAEVKLNVIVTQIPHRSEGELRGHIDTSGGSLIIDKGHLETPSLTLTVDYGTAYAAFVTRDQSALMQAFFSGKILVEGDATQLMMLQPSEPSLEVIEFVKRLDAITETGTDEELTDLDNPASSESTS